MVVVLLTLLFLINLFLSVVSFGRNVRSMRIISLFTSVFLGDFGYVPQAYPIYLLDKSDTGVIHNVIASVF